MTEEKERSEAPMTEQDRRIQSQAEAKKESDALKEEKRKLEEASDPAVSSGGSGSEKPDPEDE